MKKKVYQRFVMGLVALALFIPIIGLGVFVQSEALAEEVNSPYFQREILDLPDGVSLEKAIINGPPTPPPGVTRTTVELPQPDSQAGIKTLTVPAFNWSFGCTATTAAMIAGYYDRGSYPNMYTGPTNGGVMPLTNSSWPDWIDGSGATRHQCPLSATHKGLDGRTNRGHVDDYWVQYDSSAADPFIGNWTEHTYSDCTGDYMKTNQSRYGNTDGSTAIYNWPDGAPLYANEMVTGGVADQDGGYGLKLFYESRGYQVSTMYNQYIYGFEGNTKGFTFAQYKAQIDAGNPVMIHVKGHTMAGVGYNDSGNTVYLHDTWDYSTHSMTWGGSYAGMEHYGVTIVNLKPAPVVPVVGGVSLPGLPLLLLKDSSCPAIPNGDFESGNVSWTEYSAQGWSLIGQWGVDHSGAWSTWLGGDDNEIAYVQQQITVPSSCPYLVFYHWIASSDTCGLDNGFVKINGTNVDSIQLCSNNDTGGWVKRVVNLGAYTGQTVTLQIRVETNASVNSNWFIDDVSFQPSASAAAGLEMESGSQNVDSVSQFKTKKEFMKRR